ncbi:MAG: ATPase, T2SS/T4P/T4SS family [Anaerolineales bacterium]
MPEPQYYDDKLGHRRYSLASLREKVEAQFREETEGRPDILNELDTRPKRMAEIGTVADYVLAQEHVQLPQDARRQMIAQAVANLFYFGALDTYLLDPDITEVTIEGYYQVSIRRGFAPLERVESPFDNQVHLERDLHAVLATNGTLITASHPFIEVGLTLHDRPVRASLITPPVSPMYSVQLRLHPVMPFGLDDLVPNLLPEPGASLLRQIMGAGRGLMVTGEAGSAKTTLINALLAELPNPTDALLIERAAEMRPPGGLARRAGVPPLVTDPEGAVPFGAQIAEALAGDMPYWLVLDEIRGDDEGTPLGDALLSDKIGAMLAAFRGTSNPARLRSGFGMALLKGNVHLSPAQIDTALRQKLPYLAVLQRGKTGPHLALIARWEGTQLVPLLTWEGGNLPCQITDAPRGL